MNRSTVYREGASRAAKRRLLAGAGLAALMAAAPQAGASEAADRLGGHAGAPGLRAEAAVETSLRLKPTSGAKALIAAASTPAEGDPVTNPDTGGSETVIQVLAPGVVLSDQGNVIFLLAVGDTFTDADTGKVWRVTAVGVDGSGNAVQSLENVDDTSETLTDVPRVTDITSLIPPDAGSAGLGGSSLVFNPATGDVNIVASTFVGSNGGDGRDGGGVRVCVLGVCVEVSIRATAGGDGGRGRDISLTVDSVGGDVVATGDHTTSVSPGVSPGIQVVSANKAGITVISQGGNGGTGGDSFGNVPAARGGASGAGGNISVTNAADIVTNANGAHGIFPSSRAGRSGRGGDGWIAATGGAAGTPRSGGNVLITNSGDITTNSDDSVGVFAQSLGGASGTGGGSIGIVADGGNGSVGGNGGRAEVVHSGTITTLGANSHGIQAQSVGGSGGNAGAAGGIATFSSSGSNGGNGGAAQINVLSGGEVSTGGDGAHGLFAQSVGGSGGSGGLSIGLVALGSSGAGGGVGGAVGANVADGAQVSTSGAYAYGVFLQSVGGGGGSGGASGGLVAIGGSGSGGGEGGAVTGVINGQVVTEGIFSHGVYGQSVGGGGGDAAGAGGAVAIGGDGGAGGRGGSVALTLGSTAYVETGDFGAAGVFAQSVGGGGGSAAGTGGLVSLGGDGSSGGNGGNVTVSNDGTILTLGAIARGVFAQSVGGGGGAAAGTGGLVSLGGKGASGGDGGNVTVDLRGGTSLISTSGFASDAVFAQSVGGGGGAGAGTGGLVALGGDAGAGGAGGDVTVHGGGSILTNGVLSRGIFAQSVGGGGGSAAGAGGLVALGGKGASGGDGGDVTVTLEADTLIRTAQRASTGVFAQSVGGGGGDGGDTGGVVAIGGGSSVGGSAGDVVVSGGGSIFTDGADSFGVFAQSVGGGGGSGGNSGGLVAIGGSGAGGGDGGFVSVSTGLINTAGDRSAGVLAQSIGGGGGNGGGTGGLAAIGGSGDTGGAGGEVLVNAGGDILTEGVNAAGIIAQSVGGGGGNGGGAAAGGPFLAIAVGGGGAGGGAGGQVTVTSVAGADIVTEQDNSIGVIAQSVGGGGGNGGNAFSGSVGAFGSLGVSVGGTGGGGGDGGTVTVDLDGQVRTAGANAHGVLAQAVGGGGGNGGNAFSAAVSGGLGASVSASVSVGGGGGAAGNGGTVDASTADLIYTEGDNSAGVLAQSVGGGGGNGGWSGSATAAVSDGVGVSLGVSVGGGGGAGGFGGVVTIDSTGDVYTEGAHSHGLVAQSIGGGGGKGGFSFSGSLSGGGAGGVSVNVSLGGEGGAGNYASAVTIDSDGDVLTLGDGAHGLFAQSVGGGGGDGGWSATGSLNVGGTAGVGLGVSLGGGAGDGGEVIGPVRVSSDGRIQTEGRGAHGVLAQAIGGGGGNGGFSFSGTISGGGTAGVGANLAIGGGAGNGGHASDVEVDVTQTILTRGDGGHAIAAQSIGGGGGNGGWAATGNIAVGGTAGVGAGVSIGGGGGAGSFAGDVRVTATDTLATEGEDAFAVLAQSIGGGGGNGGFAISAGIGGGGTVGGSANVGVGGSGGGGGAAGDVTVSVLDVVTEGRGARGVLAQSIGGGGGNGGFAIAAGIGGGGTVGASVNVGVGGTGGRAGNGGEVSVSTRRVHTDGDGAAAVTAQSIGGGGGNGGWSATGNVSIGGKAGIGAGVSIGGTGGGGGNGDTVTVSASDTISTFGSDAHAVLAQSIGGGGGNGGFAIAAGVGGGGKFGGNVNVGVGGSGGGGGDASDITVSVLDILTEGDNSIGVLAQSLGGGGGNGGFSVAAGLGAGGQVAGTVNVSVGGSGGRGGSAGDVSVTTRRVQTSGEGSHGVSAQSIGGGGGNGGLAVSGGLSFAQNAVSLGLALGGEGGVGASAGAVTVEATDFIVTEGAGAHGVLAQSIGGGGGNGGGAVSGSVAGGSKNAFGVNVGLGGNGGTGGVSGDVLVTTAQTVFTQGDRANGVTAQSIGGGGGNGGFAVAGSITAAQSNSGALNVSLGGEAGAGNDAGSATIEASGQVGTEGDDSHALFAQSVGGGGGTGGFAISGAITASQQASYTGNLALGGTGGEAGDGGAASITTSDLVSTLGTGSHGVFAQSVGGGGGDGGWAATATVAAAQKQSFTLGVALGGDGAGGGDGGTASIVTRNDIATFGDNSHAIFAQSVGGGGGDGGASFSGSLGLTRSNTLNLSLGGTGGVGGVGGAVSVDHAGTIVTEGDESYGVFAQSVGGGGGSGGYAGNLSLAGSNSNTINLSLGGDAGDGSIGGDVDVDLSGIIQTSGASAHAVFAQSIGGGGGQGGMVGLESDNYLAFLSGSSGFSFGQNTRTMTVSVGGEGGVGNRGGDVSVSSEAQFSTSGNQAMGIYAQSIGGGGGEGGMGLGASAAVGAGRNSSLTIGVGGTGGEAGHGGRVEVDNLGQIVTRGGGAHGVFAQSIGGGGGRGGDAGGYVTSFSSASNKRGRNQQIGVAIGGSGGAAGDGGIVDILNSGTILVEGELSHGIFAQSVGGGGGDGGNVSDGGGEIQDVLDRITKGETRGGTINIGGSAGAAGDGGDVLVENTGAILTSNERSGHGIFAQSIGGGGGNGGNGLAGTISIGGQGGAAGDGGDVTVINSGQIVTTGAMAHGIFAQSIGGGGGTGGATDAQDDEEQGEKRSAIETILAAGGTINDVISFIESTQAPEPTLNIGGFGGAAGDGGDIVIENTGSIATFGDGAHGIMAQSIGGGGGTGGLASAGAIGDIVFSGLGGSAGDGGDITITHTGDIVTEGWGAYGIFAQSVGGGGGAAGDYSLGLGEIELQAGLNPFPGGNGDGGDITIVSQGDITIRGLGATGIFAQSVGGGGGLMGLTGMALSQLGSFGGEGEAGSVTIVHDGAVFTPDANAIAVLLQSDARDVTSDLSITLNDDIRGGSAYGMGVLFENGRNNILNTSGSISAVSGLAINTTSGNDQVNNTGIVVGDIDLGSGQNAFENQAGSTFVAFNTIDLRDGPTTTSAQAPAPAATAETGRIAIAADAQPEAQPEPAQTAAPPLTAGPAGASARPAGDQIGTVDLATFEARSGGEAVAELPVGGAPMGRAGSAGSAIAPAAAPGNAATFTNAGDFLMGLSASRVPIDLAAGETFGNLDNQGDPQTNLLFGARVINTVQLDGHYVQTSEGHLAFDVAFGPYASDIVNVTGDTVVDGTGEVILTWLESDENVTLFATAGTATDNGLEIEDTIAVDYGIVANAQGIQLTLKTDFGQDFLNRNGQALGRHLDSAIRADGSSGIGRLGALLGNLQAGQEGVYSAIFTELDPSGHLAPLQFQLDQAQHFAGELFSCESPVRRVDGQCVWTRLEASQSERTASFEAFGVEADGIHFRGGFEQEMDELWTVAAAIGYDQISGLRADGARMRSEGQALHAGLGFERTSPSGVIVGGGVTTGWQWTDSLRSQNVFEPRIGEASATSGYLTTELHVAQVFRSGRIFARPELSASATALHHAGFTEEGLDGLGMEGLTETEVVGRISPELALGAVLHEGENSAATLTVTLGADLQSENRLELPMRFLGANPAADPAIIGTTLDRESYRLSTDLHLIGSDRIGLRFGYTGEFGDAVEDHRAGFDFRMKF